MHIWLLCNCSRICFCNTKSIIFLLPFVAMLSIIASSLLIAQYCFMLCSTSSFLCGQPCIMYNFSLCRSVSSRVAACMSSIDAHTGIFTDVIMACTFIFMPVISWSFISVWLLWDSQSAMYRSHPSLYIIQYPILVIAQHDVLQLLGQCGHILTDHCN